MKKLNVRLFKENLANVRMSNVKILGDEVQGPPGQVTGVTLDPGNEFIIVDWSAVIANPLVTHYLVQHRPTPGGAWIEDNAGLALTFQINGLINGLSYDVQVAAVNSAGQGPWSVLQMATPETVPDQVTGLIVNDGVAPNSLDISYNAVVAVPAVTSYTYEYKTTVGDTWIPVNNGLNLSASILGLLNGVSYDVRVRATNDIGNGPYSTIVSATVLGVPEQIQTFNVTPGIIQANPQWLAPTSAPPLLSYTIEYKENTSGTWKVFVGTGLSTNVNIFNLEPVLTDFRVRGVNASGPGPWSNVVQTTPTAISSPRVVEWNEKGVSTNSPISSILNTGTGGAQYNLTVFNNQSNCQPNAHKGKAVWQNNGAASVRTTSPPNNLGAQATCIWVGIPFFLDSQNRLIWNSSFDTARVVAQEFNTFMTQQGPFLGTSGMDTTSTEWIVFARFGSGAASKIRIIKNGGGDVSTSGSAGNGVITPEIMGWDFNATSNLDFPAQNFELTFYDGYFSTNEENALINAMKQKWFTGVPA